MLNVPHPQIYEKFKQWKTIYTFAFGPMIVSDQIHRKKSD